MKKNTIKLTFLTFIAAGFLAAPVLMRAQDSSTNSMDGTTQAPAKHSKHGLPFHGTVSAVDASAMTLTVDSRTFKLTAKTKIMKDGEQASLADAVMGEKVSGYYHTNSEGVLTASSIHFGAAKSKKSTDSTTSTNSVSIN